MSVDELSFDFEMRTQVRHGRGRISELGDILKENIWEKVCIICDSAVIDRGSIQNAIEECESVTDHLRTFTSDVSEPAYSYLDESTEAIAEDGVDYECLVGIGGGSTMDLAKGVATLLRNEGSGLDYRGFPDLESDPVPVVAIPTTAGTGSEATFNAVFTEKADDPKESRKLGINAKENYPEYAILDPELPKSCPEPVMVSSGMDALVHTLESFAAANATAYSRMFSKEAFELLVTNLDGITDATDDIEVHRGMQVGSHYAGVALVNSGAGPAGAMSYPLGSAFDVPHGLAGAVFLPKIVRHNVENGYKGYHQLYKRLPDADETLTKSEQSKEFARRIEWLCKQAGVPDKLTKFGLGQSDKEFLLNRATTDLEAAFEQNPVPIENKDIKHILDGMF